jgi:hypothetical protein
LLELAATPPAREQRDASLQAQGSQLRESGREGGREEERERERER